MASLQRSNARLASTPQGPATTASEPSATSPRPSVAASSRRKGSAAKRRWSLSHRCILGAALAIEVLVFSTVSFAIAYAISNAAIHQAGERLASSMVDTVGARIGTYVNETEDLVSDILRTARLPGYRLPSDDSDAPGGWSLKWLLELRTRMAIAQFKISTVSVLFDDGGLTAVGTWWPNTSWVYTMSAASNRPLPPVVCNNCSDVDWSMAVTHQRPYLNLSNTGVYHVDTYAPWNPEDGVGWQPYHIHDARASGYFTLVRLFGRTAWCSWKPPDFRTFQLPGEFSFVAVCGVVNASNDFLGVVAVDRTVSDLQTFLDDTATTPNTAMFIVDSSGYLVASTTDVPFVKIFLPNDTAIPTDATYTCAKSTYVSLFRPVRVGCRQSAAAYPYPPLQAVSPEFLLTPTIVQHYGSLANANYYYVSVRVPSRFMPRYTMNLVLFLPEVDVVGDAGDRLVSSIVICLALCFAAAIFANLLIHVLVRPRAEPGTSSSATSSSAELSFASKHRRRADHHSGATLPESSWGSAPSSSFASSSGGRFRQLAPANANIRMISSAYTDVVTAVRSLTFTSARAVAFGLVLAANSDDGWTLSSDGTVVGSVVLVEVLLAVNSPTSDSELDETDTASLATDEDDDDAESWVSANDVNVKAAKDATTAGFAQHCRRVAMDTGGAIELGAPESTMAALFCGRYHAQRAVLCANAIRSESASLPSIVVTCAVVTGAVYDGSAQNQHRVPRSAAYGVLMREASTMLRSSQRWRVSVAMCRETHALCVATPSGHGTDECPLVVRRLPHVTAYLDAHALSRDAAVREAADAFSRACMLCEAERYSECLATLSELRASNSVAAADPVLDAVMAYCAKVAPRHRGDTAFVAAPS